MEQDMRLLELAADIVAAHVGNNTVAIDEVGNLVRQVYQALSDVGGASGETVAEEKPAVSVRSSVKPDHLVCLVCGSHQKALRRHIGSAHGLAPDEYRARFNLPASYPMVAADYTERRREIARSIGLGRSRGPRPAPEAAPEAAPAKRGRGRPRS